MLVIDFDKTVINSSIIHEAIKAWSDHLEMHLEENQLVLNTADSNVLLVDEFLNYLYEAVAVMEMQND